MAKIKTILDINIRAIGEVIQIDKGSYIEVSEEMAVYFCNEDIEQMSVEDKMYHKRAKHAIRTPQEEQSNNHEDYKYL